MQDGIRRDRWYVDSCFDCRAAFLATEWVALMTMVMVMDAMEVNSSRWMRKFRITADTHVRKNMHNKTYIRVFCLHYSMYRIIATIVLVDLFLFLFPLPQDTVRESRLESTVTSHHHRQHQDQHDCVPPLGHNHFRLVSI